MIRALASWSVLLGLTALWVHPVDAQVCFTGKPAPDCKVFWITEVGLGYRITEPGGDERQWPVSEIGLMKNLNKRYALGATTYVSWDARYTDFRGGGKVRLRRWINSDLSLNASAGVLFLGGSTDEKHPSFAGHIDLNYRDWIAPYIGLDVLRADRSPLDGANVHTGARFGGAVGSGLTVGAAIAIVVALVSYTIAG